MWRGNRFCSSSANITLVLQCTNTRRVSPHQGNSSLFLLCCWSGTIPIHQNSVSHTISLRSDDMRNRNVRTSQSSEARRIWIPHSFTRVLMLGSVVSSLPSSCRRDLFSSPWLTPRRGMYSVSCCRMDRRVSSSTSLPSPPFPPRGQRSDVTTDDEKVKKRAKKSRAVESALNSNTISSSSSSSVPTSTKSSSDAAAVVGAKPHRKRKERASTADARGVSAAEPAKRKGNGRKKDSPLETDSHRHSDAEKALTQQKPVQVDSAEVLGEWRELIGADQHAKISARIKSDPTGQRKREELDRLHSELTTVSVGASTGALMRFFASVQPKHGNVNVGSRHGDTAAAEQDTKHATKDAVEVQKCTHTRLRALLLLQKNLVDGVISSSIPPASASPTNASHLAGDPTVVLDIAPILGSHWNVVSIVEFMKALQFLPADKLGRRVPYESFVAGVVSSLKRWIESDLQSASSRGLSVRVRAQYPNALLIAALLLSNVTQYEAMGAPKTPERPSKKKQAEAKTEWDTENLAKEPKKRRVPAKKEYLHSWVENTYTSITEQIVGPLLSFFDAATNVGDTHTKGVDSVMGKITIATSLSTFAVPENAAILSHQTKANSQKELRMKAESVMRSAVVIMQSYESEMERAIGSTDADVEELLSPLRTSLCDVLDALILQSRCMHGSGVARDLGTFSESVRSYVDRVQQLAGRYPLLFFRCWCDFAVAARVERVPQGEWLKHIRNAVFVSASLVADNDECENTIITEETKKLQPKGSESGVSHSTLIRPRIAWALLAAGYDSEAILSSGFCVSFSPRELMETLAAFPHLCPHVATRTLPNRVQTTISTAVCSSLQQCIRDNNSNNSGTRKMGLLEMLETEELVRHDLLPAALRANPTDVQATADADTSLAAQGNAIAMLLNIYQKEDREAGGDVVAQSNPLYSLSLSMSYVVEMIVRGDSKGLAAVLPNLLAVLEQGGGVVLLDDSHEWILHAVVHRLQTIESAGGLVATQRDLGTQPVTPGTVGTRETALAALNSSFVQRFAEAVQRQLSKLKRVQVRDTSEQHGTLSLHWRTMRLCVRVCGTGMNASQARQLVSVAAVMESMLTDAAPEKSAGKEESRAESVSGVSAISEWRAGIPDEMVAFLKSVETLHSCVPEFHSIDAAGMRYANTLAVEMVSVHLCTLKGKLAAAAQEEEGKGKPLVLQVVSIIYTMLMRYGAEYEPAELRSFRTESVDPALTSLLNGCTHATSASKTSSSEDSLVRDRDGVVSNPFESMLTPEAFGEIATVVCVLRTIHHVSIEFYRSFTDALCACMSASNDSQLQRKSSDRKHLSAALSQLLMASAPICLLGNAEFMREFDRQASAVSPHLVAPDMIKVLCTINNLSIPVSGPIASIVQRLGSDAASAESPLTLPERVAALRELSRAAEQNETPREADNDTSMNILRQVSEQRTHLTVGDVGVVTGVVAQLRRSSSYSSVQDGEASAAPAAGEDNHTGAGILWNLPTKLYDQIVNSRHTALPEQVTAIVQGYSALPNDDEYVEIKKKVMHGFILQTITVAPRLTPLQIVECLESYLDARTSHEYLFGVLLARVGDVRQKFTLPLAVRLVQCCVKAKYDSNVQRACETAAHPVFIGIVRGRLKNDPVSLAAVGSSAATVLRSLREVFPHDPINEAVLHNIALYIDRVPTPAIIAALRLIEAKGSLDYGILRTVVSYTVEHVVPDVSPGELSEVSLLLVRCGARSPVLINAVSKRFSETRDAFDGRSLGKLCRMFVEAKAETVDDVHGIVCEVVETLESTQRKDPLKKETISRRSTNSTTSSRGDGLQRDDHQQAYGGSTARRHTSVSPVDIVSVVEFLNSTKATDESTRALEILLRSLTDMFAMEDHRSRETGVGKNEGARTGGVIHSSSPSPKVNPSGPESEPVLSVTQLSTILSAYVQHNIRCDPKSYALFEAHLAKHLQRHESWHADLFLVVKLAESVVALRGRNAAKQVDIQKVLAESKVLAKLLDIIFDRRANLMKRQQLLQPVTDLMRQCGPSVHESLYSLLMDSEMDL